MKITCTQCGIGPLDGRALYRDKGALFSRSGWGTGHGPLFCAAHASAKVKAAILATVRIDSETKALAND